MGFVAWLPLMGNGMYRNHKFIKKKQKTNKIMKNETKLERVKRFLDENGTRYESRANGAGHSDLWLPDLRIAIKMEGDDDALFFETHSKSCFPVFIRDADTLGFVREKLRNTIIKAMVHMQGQLTQRQEALERREERKRLAAERKRHMEEQVRRAKEKRRMNALERKMGKGHKGRKERIERGEWHEQSVRPTSGTTPVRRRRPRIGQQDTRPR